MNKKDTPIIRLLQKKITAVERSFYHYLRLTEKTIVEHDLDWQHEMLLFYSGYLRELEALLEVAVAMADSFPIHPRRTTFSRL